MSSPITPGASMHQINYDRDHIKDSDLMNPEFRGLVPDTFNFRGSIFDNPELLKKVRQIQKDGLQNYGKKTE